MAAIQQALEGSRGRYGARKVFALGLERMATRQQTTIGCIAPREAEAAFYARLSAAEKAA
jgi:hypothetical protein